LAPKDAARTGAEALNEPIPAGDRRTHFDGGQTEATVELPPGTHPTLPLVLGEQKHIPPHNPPVMSETIGVTVE
jgi:hypothetical protein